MSHVVDSCPLTKLAGGLSKLHSAGDDVIAWLTNCGGPQRMNTRTTTTLSLSSYIGLMDIALLQPVMAALCSRCRHYIFALWFLCFFFFLLLFSSPNLSGRRLDVYHTSTYGGRSANLECRSEMCCMWLAGNAGPKNDAKNCYLCTIAQLCRAVSSQLRHVSTIIKKTC